MEYTPTPINLQNQIYHDINQYSKLIINRLYTSCTFGIGIIKIDFRIDPFLIACNIENHIRNRYKFTYTQNKCTCCLNNMIQIDISNTYYNMEYYIIIDMCEKNIYEDLKVKSQCLQVEVPNDGEFVISEKDPKIDKIICKNFIIDSEYCFNPTVGEPPKIKRYYKKD